MIRVLYVTDVENPSSNGVIAAVSKYASFGKSNARVAIYNLGTEFKVPGVRIFDGGHYEKIVMLPYGFSSPDIVVFNEVYKKKYLGIYRECLKKGIPYIVIPHGCLVKKNQHEKYFKKKIANRLLFNRFLNNASAIQFLNQYEKENSIVVKSAYIIHGNGIDCVRKKNQKNRAGKKIVFVGRYSISHKGIDLMMSAIANIHDYLKDNNICFFLYGRDSVDTIKDVCALASDNGLNDIVSINGPVYGEEKERVLTNADLFILTSRYEGEPISIIEALAHGVPCIVTHSTSFGEDINGFHCGISVDPDVEQISDAIIKITSANDLSLCSDNAIRLVKKKFLWSSVMKKTIADYEKIVFKKQGNERSDGYY